ncbi:MAG: transcription-repair coupling factor [Gammaproteobacteria bacterium]|nr:transcription-repair coupling factor [Gammaproteobacteria bacterium]
MAVHHKTSSALLNPPLPAPSDSVTWNDLHGSALGCALAEAASLHEGVVLIVLDDQHELAVLEDEIRYFLGNRDIPVLQFPGLECLPYDALSPHGEIGSERIRILSALPTMKRGVLLVQAGTLLQRLPPVEYIDAHAFMISVGQKVDFDEMRHRLANSNYLSVDLVVSPGEFASRGGLIDVFPMGAASPFRLEFFDDEIESIRFFDPDTQRSTGEVPQLGILPAREFPLTESGIDRFRLAFRKAFQCDPKSQSIYNEVSRGNAPSGIEFYLPLFFGETASLFDYLDDSALVATPSQVESLFSGFLDEVEERYESYRHDASRRILPPGKLYLSVPETMEAILALARVELDNPQVENAWSAPCRPTGTFPVNPRQANAYDGLVEHLNSTPDRTLIMAGTQGRLDMIDHALIAHHLQARPFEHHIEFLQAKDCGIGLAVGPVARGLHSPQNNLEIISEGQLFGERVLQQRRRSRFSKDPETIIKSLAELHIDDPVIHVDHGVGRYKGLHRLDVPGDETEYLMIEYQNGDKLYIPALSLHLVNRYIGGTPDTAPLHRLGAKEWETARKKAREKTYDVAAELLEMDAMRQARKGIAYPVDKADFDQFCNEFPFEETPDQLQSITDVIQDLVSPLPMDRLVCGDVGFGKTEIALRAAFIATHSGRQVAILTPTTLLAQQHYETFVDRFSKWPVMIEVLSRFKTEKQRKEIVNRARQGGIDILIGTHRLLQEDIHFANLGLVIIDEEHRFGVRQKEQLKKLREQVDILTLTATPIPRTLNMAMSGMRSISVIATPPVNRLSIRTFIRDWDARLIREACLREIRRGGQVFFLHNNVRSIERTAEELQELVPEATVRVGHGQMPEIRLEMIMLDFYHQRFNVLVCSTIIESGIDIPTANTIIINRADRFGLAQLHQLRGRVGRSHHQAYAYLLVPDLKHITKNAHKRLDAIRSMGDLGSGFMLASHDLEIRGAGELLGETQSGLIDEVGFSLYSEYLNMAIQSIRDGVIPEHREQDEQEKAAQIELHVPALFPENYLPDAHSRLIFYKRISNALSVADLDELQIEAIDRFGLLPDPARNLFRLTALRISAERLGIHKIDIDETGGVIEFRDKPAVDMPALFGIIHALPRELKPRPPGSIVFLPRIDDPYERVDRIEKLIGTLHEAALPLPPGSTDG